MVLDPVLACCMTHSASNLPCRIWKSAFTANPFPSSSFSKPNPDWLFVIDRDAGIGREGQSARQLLDNEIIRSTDAWQKGQVVYLNPGDWYLAGGGLTALRKTVGALQVALSGKGS